MRILMREGDELTIEIPGGKEISILYTPAVDDGSLPEIDIMLPEELCAKCWGEHLAAGKPLKDQPWTIECKQIVIPIEAHSFGFKKTCQNCGGRGTVEIFKDCTECDGLGFTSGAKQ